MLWEEWNAALAITLAMLQAVAGLIAVWVGTSRVHWFWRGIVALAAVALLIPPRAYAPALRFLIELTVVFGLCSGARWWRGRPAPSQRTAWRFSLADLLKTTVLFGAGTGLLTKVFAEPVWSAKLVGRALVDSAIAVAVAWLVFSCRDGKFIIRRVVAILAVLCAAAYARAQLDASDAFVVVPGLGIGGDDEWMMLYARRLFVTILAALAMVVCMVAARALRTGRPKMAESFRGAIRTSTIAISFLIVIGSVAWLSTLWWKMTFLPPLPKADLPSPNGYDTIRRAAQLLRGDTTLDGDTADVAALTKSADANHEALQAMFVGLSQSYQVPVVYDAQSFSTADLSTFRDLFRALRIRADMQFKNGSPDEAARDLLRGYELGMRCYTGGLNVHLLVGLAIGNGAIERLSEARGQLSIESCRWLPREILAIKSDRESLEAVRQRERFWCLYANGYVGAFETALSGIDSDRNFQWALDRNDVATRLLVIELALRAFQADNGRVAESLERLVPRYLPTIPHDPYSGGPFIYQPASETEFLLYSVGPDLQDDHGNRTSWDKLYQGHRGDVLLDLKED